MITEHTRFVLLHYHFFKNAGTTIEEILAHSFGYFARLDTPDREGHLSNRELLEFLRENPLIQAVSSHHLHYPMPQARGFLFFDICVLRDPIDRIGSIYSYFRQKPAAGEPASELANQFELGEFAARLIERAPYYITNPQVSLLGDGGWSGPPGRETLQRALRVMRDASFLGVVDRFHQSLLAGEYLLKPAFPTLDCAQPRANASAKETKLDARIARLREACGDSVYDELLRLNTLDLELVGQARAEVERRFTLVPRREERLARLERALESARATAPAS